MLTRVSCLLWLRESVNVIGVKLFLLVEFQIPKSFSVWLSAFMCTAILIINAAGVFLSLQLPEWFFDGGSVSHIVLIAELVRTMGYRVAI